uniref:Uncharacterized protein n=1 Tax=Tetranychus urticae TaxID=32264 RepID=T1JV06_TETUR
MFPSYQQGYKELSGLGRNFLLKAKLDQLKSGAWDWLYKSWLIEESVFGDEKNMTVTLITDEKEGTQIKVFRDFKTQNITLVCVQNLCRRNADLLDEILKEFTGSTAQSVKATLLLGRYRMISCETSENAVHTGNLTTYRCGTLYLEASFKGLFAKMNRLYFTSLDSVTLVEINYKRFHVEMVYDRKFGLKYIPSGHDECIIVSSSFDDEFNYVASEDYVTEFINELYFPKNPVEPYSKKLRVVAKHNVTIGNVKYDSVVKTYLAPDNASRWIVESGRLEDFCVQMDLYSNSVSNEVPFDYELTERKVICLLEISHHLDRDKFHRMIDSYNQCFKDRKDKVILHHLLADKINELQAEIYRIKDVLRGLLIDKLNISYLRINWIKFSYENSQIMAKVEILDSSVIIFETKKGVSHKFNVKSTGSGQTHTSTIDECIHVQASKVNLSYVITCKTGDYLCLGIAHGDSLPDENENGLNCMLYNNSDLSSTKLLAGVPLEVIKKSYFNLNGSQFNYSDIEFAVVDVTIGDGIRLDTTKIELSSYDLLIKANITNEESNNTWYLAETVYFKPFIHGVIKIQKGDIEMQVHYNLTLQKNRFLCSKITCDAVYTQLTDSNAIQKTVPWKWKVFVISLGISLSYNYYNYNDDQLLSWVYKFNNSITPFVLLSELDNITIYNSINSPLVTMQIEKFVILDSIMIAAGQQFYVGFNETLTDHIHQSTVDTQFDLTKDTMILNSWLKYARQGMGYADELRYGSGFNSTTDAFESLSGRTGLSDTQMKFYSDKLIMDKIEFDKQIGNFSYDLVITTLRVARKKSSLDYQLIKTQKSFFYGYIKLNYEPKHRVYTLNNKWFQDEKIDVLTLRLTYSKNLSAIETYSLLNRLDELSENLKDLICFKLGISYLRIKSVRLQFHSTYLIATVKITERFNFVDLLIYRKLDLSGFLHFLYSQTRLELEAMKSNVSKIISCNDISFGCIGITLDQPLPEQNEDTSNAVIYNNLDKVLYKLVQEPSLRELKMQLYLLLIVALVCVVIGFAAIACKLYRRNVRISSSPSISLTVLKDS